MSNMQNELSDVWGDDLCNLNPANDKIKLNNKVKTQNAVNSLADQRYIQLIIYI